MEKRAGLDHVMAMLEGYQATCLLLAAVQLGVLEALSQEPRTAEEVATLCHTHLQSTDRLLRALACAGLVTSTPDAYELSDEGRLLLPTGSLAHPWALLIAGEHLPVWQVLSRAVRDGNSAFESVFGQTAWQHRQSHPQVRQAFDEAMANMQQTAVRDFLDAYPIPDKACVVDVGGGRGTLLGGILDRYPETTGILFDLPEVVTGSGFDGSRCRVVAGSFLEEVPRGDILILRNCLHNWPDSEGRTILRNCRRALPEHGRLVVLEPVLPEEGLPELRAALFDLHMLVCFGGRERTVAELLRLAEEVGLKLHSRRQLGPSALLELSPDPLSMSGS